jgi:hypothetical protein
MTGLVKKTLTLVGDAARQTGKPNRIPGSEVNCR